MDGPLRIDTMYAFVAKDTDGTEGLVAFFNVRAQQWVPMVGADMTRIDQLRPIAQSVAAKPGTVITLVHFTTRTDIEVIKPST